MSQVTGVHIIVGVATSELEYVTQHISYELQQFRNMLFRTSYVFYFHPGTDGFLRFFEESNAINITIGMGP